MKTNHQRGFRGQPDNTTDAKYFYRRVASGKYVWTWASSAEEGLSLICKGSRRF